MRTRSFYFLCYIFKYLPRDLVFMISKYVGKYITFNEPVYEIYKTKQRKDKYVVRHKIRAYSI